MQDGGMEIFMLNFCMCGAAKAVGLSLLTFTIGVIIGMVCPIQALAVIELIMLVLVGYLCLCKW